MTVKKFIALTSAALAAVAITASAQVAVDVTSAYVFRGEELSDEVSVQPGFDTEILGGAVSVGTWANFNTDSSQFDEIDYFFGIPIPLGEDSPVSLEIGYTEYVYPGVEGDADREPYLSLGTEVEGIELGLLAAYGIDGAIDKSLYLELSAGTSVDLAENISLGLGAALGYVDPDEGESGFSHLTLSAGTEIGIPETDHSFSIGVSYVVETDEDVLAVDTEVYGTIGFTL
ncbi:MAG: TorF family putative porin [Kiritimatiellia bacterium]